MKPKVISMHFCSQNMILTPSPSDSCWRRDVSISAFNLTYEPL